MDKLHAFAAWLHNAMAYKIDGVVPVYFPTVLVVMAMINQAIKIAKWTTAQADIELAARFLLKFPTIGAWIAALPIAGDLLHYLANDTANLPPSFAMRVKAALPTKKDPPSDKPPGATGTVPPAAVVALLFLGLATLASCKPLPPCTAANANDARCKAEAVGTDCAAPEVAKIVVDIAARVSAALQSNDYSNLLSDIAADLEKQGRADGMGVLTCALLDVTSRPTAARDTATNTAATRANAYMTAHPAKVKNTKAGK